MPELDGCGRLPLFVDPALLEQIIRVCPAETPLSEFVAMLLLRGLEIDEEQSND